MKYILKSFIISLLLRSGILLSDAVYISEQQPFNPIVSDSFSFNDNRHIVQCVADLPVPVSFITEHKHFKHHTSNPSYSLDCMSTEQLIWFFTTNNYTQDQILSCPLLYMRSAYLAIAKQLPKYSRYVKRYHDEYKKLNWFTKGLGRALFIYTPKLQRQFALLWQECEKQRIAQEKHEQQQREWCAKQEQEARERKVAEARIAYVRELERVENIVRDSSVCKSLSVNGRKARLEAIKVSQQHPEQNIRKLQTGQDVVAFAQSYGIPEQQITKVTMNGYEYQLHKEFISHVHSALGFKRQCNIQDQNVFIDALGNGIAIGIKSNHLHNPEWATRWADFGHEAIEIIRGIGEGIVLGSYNTVDMVMHPVRTLVRMVDGVRMLGSLTARTIGTLAHWNYLIEHGECLQCATEMSVVGEQLIGMATAIHEHTTHMSNRDIAKDITAFGTEWALTGQMFIMSHTLCSNMGQMIQKTIRFLKEEEKAGEFILATVDGVLIKASENVNKAGGAVSDIVRNTRTILEAVHAEYMAGLEAEIELLRLVFDNKIKGAAELANKFIKVNYKHILGIEELSWGRKGFLESIKGFHHDVMQHLERTGIIKFTNKVLHENGFYKADLVYQGETIKRGATFFPSEWHREKVISKIYEAYDNFVKSGASLELTRDQKFFVKSMTNEGVKIEMYITQNGKIVTAYPKL